MRARCSRFAPDFPGAPVDPGDALLQHKICEPFIFVNLVAPRVESATGEKF